MSCHAAERSARCVCACACAHWQARHNIGFAMDTPLGLVVPNIKDVQVLRVLTYCRVPCAAVEACVQRGILRFIYPSQAKSIFEISAEMQRLIDAGGRSALQAADLTDGASRECP